LEVGQNIPSFYTQKKKLPANVCLCTSQYQIRFDPIAQKSVATEHDHHNQNHQEGQGEGVSSSFHYSCYCRVKTLIKL
jgi:hypothetical protein